MYDLWQLVTCYSALQIVVLLLLLLLFYLFIIIILVIIIINLLVGWLNDCIIFI